MFHCSICRSDVKAWETYGLPPRSGQCPQCGSKPRYRAIALYLERFLSDSPDLQVLEIGPSKMSTRKILGGGFYKKARYTGIDARPLAHLLNLPAPHRGLKMNATKLDFPDHSFDLVLCNHVLSYIKDDILVLREIKRVLKPGGTAMINTPLSGLPQTQLISDLVIQDPATYTDDFLTTNGTEYLYGDDFFNRAQTAGLAVKRVRVSEWMDQASMKHEGLRDNEEFFLAQN